MVMRQIETKIVADSISPQGHRITSMLLTYPRIIHSELMTHRVFSRNSASSRAIPFNKMVKMVEEDPFIPIAWQKDHKGMQGSEYFTTVDEIKEKEMYWLTAKSSAINMAQKLNNHSTTKQLCNRLLEPFMWHTTLVSSTEFSNFFKLRCPEYNYLFDFYKSKKDVLKASEDGKYNDGRNFSDFTTEDWLGINSSQVEIHIQALAEAMWDAMNESIPKELKAGEWHIPFGDNIDECKIEDLLHGPYRASYIRKEGDVQQAKIEISTARCARLSYMTFDGEIDYEKDIKLHDTLLESHHMSPFEHCARAMTDEEYFHMRKGWVHENLDGDIDTSAHGWCNNFQGFIPYRYLIEELYEN